MEITIVIDVVICVVRSNIVISMATHINKSKITLQINR